MASSSPDIIYGAAGAIGSCGFEEVEEFFAVLQNHNVKAIDTAYIYDNSEVTLGQHHAAKRFSIHTKALGITATGISKQATLNSVDESLKRLGVDSVELYYLHSPDPDTPLEETLSAIQEIYAAGKFKYFGLSNFLPEDVQKVYDIQAAANSVLPTVFQGNYNALSRVIEGDLFPLLRKLNISFTAYSPIAGGFLAQDVDKVRTKDVAGRYAATSASGRLYSAMYGKESLLKALDVWEDIATDAGISKAALAYRWIAYHSALKKEHGDGIIVGASKVHQLEETLAAIEAGPLEPSTAKRVDDIWETVKHEAPRDNWNDYISKYGLH